MTPLGSDKSFNIGDVDFSVELGTEENLVKNQDTRIDKLKTEIFVGKREYEIESEERELWSLDIAYEKGWVEIDEETKKINVNEMEFDIVLLGKKKDKKTGAKRHAVGVRDERSDDYKNKVLHFHRKGKKLKVLDSKDITIKKLNEEEMKKVFYIASIAIQRLSQQQMEAAKETEEKRRGRMEKLRNRKLTLNPLKGNETDKQRKKISELIFEHKEKKSIRDLDEEADKKKFEEKTDKIKKEEDKKKRFAERGRFYLKKDEKLERIK